MTYTQTKEKLKRDPVTPEMRSRLLANRDGKLTTQQYKDVIMAPFISLLVMLMPLAVVLGWRFAFVTIRGLLFVVLVGGVMLGIPLVMRARRYARAPVHYAVLNAGGDSRPPWLFWRSQPLYTESGKRLRFGSRLAPYLPLQKNDDYLVYYLVDPGNYVLLSIAPVNHPDADKWRPSGAFQTRLQQRTRR